MMPLVEPNVYDSGLGREHYSYLFGGLGAAAPVGRRPIMKAPIVKNPIQPKPPVVVVKAPDILTIAEPPKSAGGLSDFVTKWGPWIGVGAGAILLLQLFRARSNPPGRRRR